MRESERFGDRRDAGRRLAAALADRGGADPVVLALPRGGVPVGFEVARALRAPLGVVLVRKIGAPGHPEFGIGAVVDGAEVVLNEEALRMVAPPPGYVEAETRRQIAEIERRRRAYVGDRPPVPTRGRTVIVADDGIATGGTAEAALRAIRRAGAAQIVLAVLVAPPEAVARLSPHADALVCLLIPEPFRAVSLHFRNFEQTTDEEVMMLLRNARAFEPTTPDEADPQGDFR